MRIVPASFERVLWVPCPILLFAVMFGHMAAVVNVSLGVTALGLAAAAWSDRGTLSRWPLALPVALWAAWSLAAVGWSAFPRVSLHAWLDEVLYPLLTFWAFWRFARSLREPAWAAVPSWLAAALLAAMSAVYWGHLQPPTPTTFPLRFYARVGHTSSLALFAIPVFTGLVMGRRWRVVGLTGIVLCAFIGLASLNRFFWPAFVATIFIAAFPAYRDRPKQAVTVLVVLSLAVSGLALYGSVQRFGDALPAPAAERNMAVGHGVDVPKTVIAFDDAVLSDTRPRLWAFYAGQAIHHFWTGVGFGKPLPGLALRPRMPPALVALEPQAATHAHNLFLNTWLQTGFIGVALQSALFLALALRFWRVRRADEWIAAAGVALVVGMVVKNLTDDFMWKTTMLAFWCVAGLLLGAAERRTGLSGGIAPVRHKPAGARPVSEKDAGRRRSSGRSTIDKS